MLKTPIARGVALATLGATLAIPTMAQAAFVDDSKVNLELRNFYYNSDNRSVASDKQSKSEEWAQGFILRAESGYTEGTVGFGVDALGLLGVKLDSGRGRTGTGLLPIDNDGSAPNEYSELGLTAKAKISNTVLKVGTLEPKNMAVARSDSRLLPQTFKGGQLVSQEVKGLTLDVGYLTEVNERNDSHYDDLQAQLRGGATQNEIDNFIFAGASYKLLENLTGSYYYSNLEEAYKQHSFNLIHVQPLGEGQSLKTDLRYARSTDDGSSTVDNKAFGAMVTYSLSGHSFGLGYQKMSGDTGFAYLNGTDPYLVNYVMISSDYANADEKSWQARYDYNFAAIGIPGLTFMTRYVTGDNFDFGTNTGRNGKEWERNTDIGYVFQEGSLKNLGIKWRNGTYRSNSTRDIDQNRLIVSYTIPLM
ncbi:OprD family porin [Stutzerimonas chloritidismutans]|uniref:OprD family porin n=1 Tax=Stutzerimonas chloritidismutans TaxID=203192 RepID=UPI003F18C15D